MTTKMLINDVPLDCLVEIFTKYVETEGLSVFLQNIVPVCRKWRKAAAHPVFWRTADDTALDRDQLLWLSKEGFLKHTRSLKLRTHSKGITNGDVMTLLEHCPNLESLKVVNDNLTAHFFLFLAANCPKLTTLWVFGIDICLGTSYCSSQSLEPFLGISGRNIKYLDLSGSILTDSLELMTLIADSCHSMEEFYFFRRPDQDFDFHFPVVKFQECCPRLKVLKLQVKSWRNMSVDEEHWPGFPLMRSFRADIKALTNFDLRQILGKSTRLEELELNNCSNVSSTSIAQIPSMNVRKLGLTGKISGDLKQVMARWRHSLYELRLFKVNSDDEVAHPVSPALLTLVHFNCTSPVKLIDLAHTDVSFSVISIVIRRCPDLKELYLYDCNLLPECIRKAYTNREDIERLALSYDTERFIA